METKINVKSHTIKNGWFNVKTNDGREINILSSSNPKATAFLNENQSGELEIKLVQKDGKNYGWDISEKKGGGFKKDPAADRYKQALIVGQSSMTKAVELCIAGKIKEEQIKAAAEKFTGYVYEIADKYGKEQNG